MKWRQRVRVMTGQSCGQIVLNLAVIASLLAGWMSERLVAVGLALCLVYVLTFLLMVLLQRQTVGRLRELGNFLEELTTSWYFGASLLTLWLLSKVTPHFLLLVVLGVAMLAGPTLLSLLMRERQRDSGDFPSEQNERR